MLHEGRSPQVMKLFLRRSNDDSPNFHLLVLVSTQQSAFDIGILFGLILCQDLRVKRQSQIDIYRASIIITYFGLSIYSYNLTKEGAIGQTSTYAREIAIHTLLPLSSWI